MTQTLETRLVEGPANEDLNTDFLLAIGFVKKVDAWHDPAGKYLRDESWPVLSVDDALAMVPEGWIVAELRQWVKTPNPEPAYWTCALSQQMRPTAFVRIDGEPKTAALAICLAILRAKEKEG